MFALRRAAARAAFTQPTRQISSLRPASRLAQFQQEKPALYRSFHQTWRSLAEERETKPVEASPAEAQTSGETVTTEPSEAETGQTQSETVQEKVKETAEEAKSTVGNVVEQAQQFASSAADRVQNAASGVARKAREQFPPRSTDSGRNVATNRVLFVGNLFFEVNAAQLEAEFGQFGTITNSKVITDQKGMSRGFGYIEFSTQEAADKAIRELDQQVFQGRRMSVQHHERREPRNRDNRDSVRPSRGTNPPSKTLFIGNMSYQMSDKDLNDVFKDIKDVLDVRVAIDRSSGQPRGFAHADFLDIASAERAKEQLEQKTVYNRQLRVDFSTGSSTRTEKA